MKIIVYSYDDTGNPWCGGGGALRIETVHSLLAENGHDITFITGNYPGASKKWKGPFKKVFVGLKWSYLLSRVSYFILANFHSLVSKADIFLAAFSAYAPVFIFLYKKNVIVEFYHLLGKRCLEKYHIFGIFPFLSEKIMLSSARTIITMAPGTKQDVLDHYPDKNIHALPCGFDNLQLQLEPLNEKYILTFGRLDIYMKGLDRLISTMSDILINLPDYKLIIAGRGSDDDIKQLYKLSEQSPIHDKIQIILKPDYSAKLDLFRKCTYVAIFSRFEGWCIVAIEAAAAGKAILGVDVEGLRDSVANDFNGILVKDFDRDQLVVYGKKLLTDDAFRSRYEKNARIHASRFTWSNIAEMQLSVYKEHLRELT